MSRETKKTPFKLENKNLDFVLETPEERSVFIRKIWDENHVWRAWNEDTHEVLEDNVNIRHDFNPNGIDLLYYRLKMKTKPKGVVFLVHGLACSQRINCSIAANYFASRGFEVLGFDQEGHGRNVPVKKDRCYITNYRKLYYNTAYFIDHFLQHEKERFEDIPVFVWGMSMGGAIVSSLLCSKELKGIVDKISGAMINAPAIEMQQKPNWIAYQALLVASTLLPTMIFPAGEMVKVSNFEGNQEWFDNHPETFVGVKIATGRELVRMGDYIQKNSRRVRKPVMIVHGTLDLQTKFSASERFFNEIKSKKKTFVRVKDIYHGLFCDRCCIDILDVQAQWMDHRVSDFHNKNGEEEEGEESEEESEEEEGKEEKKGFFSTISDLSMQKEDFDLLKPPDDDDDDDDDEEEEEEEEEEN